MGFRELGRRIRKQINSNTIEDMAKSSGFKSRNSGKIEATDFIWLTCFSGNNICTKTLEELCASLVYKRDIKISPQGLDQRINRKSVEFLKKIFLYLCQNQMKYDKKSFKNWSFSKILLMDSTEIKLHKSLETSYKGTCHSAAKLNLLMELLSFTIKNISLVDGVTSEHRFLKNTYSNITPNSLILKDLGYFQFEDFKEIDKRGGYFISRLRSGVRLFTLNPNPKRKKNGEILKKSKYLVTNVGKLGEGLAVGETKEYEFLVGSHNEKLPYRIVLSKLDEESYNKRLENVKAREKDGHCAKLTRESLGISAYITNLYASKSEDIVQIYRLRWQIELLFKVFKSDFQINDLKNIKIERIETYIYATLIKIVLLMELNKGINNGFSEEISIKRVLKSSACALDDFLRSLENEDEFLRLCTKIESIICKKNKKFPAQ